MLVMRLLSMVKPILLLVQNGDELGCSCSRREYEFFLDDLVGTKISV